MASDQETSAATSQQADAGNDDVVLNEGRLDEICCGVPGMRTTLLEMFRAETAKSVDGLAAAADQRKTCWTFAHDIKGSAANMGFMRMANCAERLCRSTADDAADADAEQWRQHVGTLVAAWRQTDVWILAALQQAEDAQEKEAAAEPATKRARTLRS